MWYCVLLVAEGSRKHTDSYSLKGPCFIRGAVDIALRHCSPFMYSAHKWEDCRILCVATNMALLGSLSPGLPIYPHMYDMRIPSPTM
jgi:hypothetical protein